MTGPRRVAFCFHHAAPSGASLWLQRFLLARPWDPAASLVILPGPSPLREPLEQAGFPCEEVSLSQVALSAGKLSLAAERVTAVHRYHQLFRRHGMDVVYTNSCVQIAPMMAARTAGARLIVHVHEGWSTGRTFPLKKAAVRTLAHGALFASRRGIDLFGGQPRGRRWEFSPNGTAVHPADAALRARTRAEWGLTDDQPAVLFLGSLIRRKGVHDLVEAWPRVLAAHPTARLFTAGLTEESEQDPQIVRLAANSVEGVRHLGFLRDVRPLLEACDFFVLPSYGEAFPLSIIEAMAAARPVIARTVGDVAWQLADGRGYPFSGDGPAPLIDALLAALTDPESRDRAVRAQHFVRDHLTPEAQQAQIRKMIEEV